MEFVESSIWADALRSFAPAFVRESKSLARLSKDGSILLHGSTTLGIVDAHSDLDSWLLAPANLVAEFDRHSPTRFIEFQLNGKAGHITVEAFEDFSKQVERCNFPLIAELRKSVLLQDKSGGGARLVELSRRPMREDVRSAWFRYHYVEMRGEHRACDNPMERGHGIAVLIAATKCLEHAIRAAAVLDGEPYHYSKWLAPMAALHPVGARVVELANDAIHLMNAEVFATAGPEKENRLSQKLREIRLELNERAKSAGIDGDWLTHWWLHINEARRGIAQVCW